MNRAGLDRWCVHPRWPDRSPGQRTTRRGYPRCLDQGPSVGAFDPQPRRNPKNGAQESAHDDGPKGPRLRGQRDADLPAFLPFLLPSEAEVVPGDALFVKEMGGAGVSPPGCLAMRYSLAGPNHPCPNRPRVEASPTEPARFDPACLGAR